MSFYAVARGVKPAIYTTWKECSENVLGFRGAMYKKFASKNEAERYLASAARSEAAVAARSEAAVAARSEAAVAARSEAATAKTVGEKSRKRRFEGCSVRKTFISEEQYARLNRQRQLIAFAKNANWTCVFTDGNANNNGGRNAVAGCGIKSVDLAIACRAPGAQTNNRAELFAFAVALSLCRDVERLALFVDSEYVAKGVNDPAYLSRWRVNGWLRSGAMPVKNQDLWKLIAALLDERSAESTAMARSAESATTARSTESAAEMTVTSSGRKQLLVAHVSAHQGIEMNEAADALATRGKAAALCDASTITQLFPLKFQQLALATLLG